MVTVEETPRLVELCGRDVLKVLHAYGVNGIITEVEVPLAPWQPWARAHRASSRALGRGEVRLRARRAEGIAKKEIGVFDGRIPPLLKRIAPLVPAGAAMAIVMVSEPQAPVLAEMVADHGGEIVFARGAEEAEAAAFDGKGSMPPLYEYTWNHTTLHALKVEPAITYLQVRFPAGGEIALVEELERTLGDELARASRIPAPLRPGLRLGPAASALPVAGAARRGRRDRSRRWAARRRNPHSYVLDDAGWKRTDAPQAEFKSLADPHGLMNPGKLRAWPPAAVVSSADPGLQTFPEQRRFERFGHFPACNRKRPGSTLRTTFSALAKVRAGPTGGTHCCAPR